MNKIAIETNNAPAAIGTYSQAIKTGNMLYVSGQIPLQAQDMTVVTGDFSKQMHQVLGNLRAVVLAGGATLSDVVKLTVYLTDLKQFETVNEIMKEYFHPPYPARAALQVAALPKDVQVEIDAIVTLPE